MSAEKSVLQSKNEVWYTAVILTNIWRFFMMCSIKYAVLCHIGYMRDKNQDNFWCDGFFLQSENKGLPEPLYGEHDVSDNPAFAVFDGMGGEQQGEMAAHIAASNFGAAHRENDKNGTKEFLLDICTEINNEICEYQNTNHIRQMGTTAAILMCGKDAVYICNVGDSRTYHYRRRKLTQVSLDHIEPGITDRKARLTQNLGVPAIEFVIEPYIAKGVYRNNDRYLLCSDGLTDMVTEKELEDVFIKKMDIEETAQTLMDIALRNGGADNITVIVCEIRKKKRF